MAITVHEIAKSRRFTISEGNATGETKFIAYRSDDYQMVYQEVSLVAPQTLEGLNLKGFSPEDVGGGVWVFTANYALPREVAGPDVGTPGAPPVDVTQGEEGDDGIPGSNVDPVTNGLPGAAEPLGPEWSFSTTGGTEKLLRSLATLETQPAGAPNYDRAVNVTANGVEGVEVPLARLELTCKKTYTFMTLQYIRLLAYMTNCTNLGQWGPFPSREMLFLGAEAQQDQLGKWVVTYRFLNARTEKNIVIREARDINGVTFPPITIETKKGHDYLWCTLTQPVDGDALSVQVQSCYVEQMFPTINFNKLWI